VLVLRGKGLEAASQGDMLLNQMPGARLVFAGVAHPERPAGWLGDREHVAIPIIGLTINRAVDELHPRIVHDTEEALAMQGMALNIKGGDVVILDDYVGPGYAAASHEGLAAIALAARAEGLLLDPCYTGKAMAGVIDLARRLPA
jgi:D-cysteine desulfhydrase